jgi:hypothetical protein
VGGRGHLMYPTKYFKKFGHKGALKAWDCGPPRFSHPQVPPSKEFENNCASILYSNCKKITPFSVLCSCLFFARQLF